MAACRNNSSTHKATNIENEASQFIKSLLSCHQKGSWPSYPEGGILRVWRRRNGYAYPHKPLCSRGRSIKVHWVCVQHGQSPRYFHQEQLARHQHPQPPNVGYDFRISWLFANYLAYQPGSKFKGVIRIQQHSIVTISLVQIDIKISTVLLQS